jgi:hypothetical protein
MRDRSKDEITRLNTWIDEIAEALKPTARLEEQSDGSIRLGSNGSLSIGPATGIWYDFEADKGGRDALALIQHLLVAEETGEQDGVQIAEDWAREWLDNHLGEGSLNRSSETSLVKVTEKRTRLIAYANELLVEIVSPESTPTEKYLRSRGLEPPYPDSICHLQDARMGEGAMVALFTDTSGDVTAIQLTYLTPRGKKSTVSPVRRSLGLVPGGASMGLFRTPSATGDGKPESTVLAEGIEDTLSLWKASISANAVGIPGISYLGKSPIGDDLPLVIFRDGDAVGSPASKAIRRGVDRLIMGGINPVSVTPTPEGSDANDVFHAYGPGRILELIENAEKWELSSDGEIQNLSKLSTLDYEQCRKEKARNLGIRVNALDELVQNLRQEEQPAANTHIMAKDVDPWPENVNLAEVLDEGVASLQKYVHLNEAAACTVLLWAAHTFVHGMVSVSPRLGIQSPEKGCGKTTLMEAVALMVPKPVTASSISTASVFRLIESIKPTLLLDEADQLFRSENADLLAVLNSSHRKASAYVIRTVEISPGNFQPTLFSTFAPVVFAGISELPPTLQDRSLIIRLERALPGEVRIHLEDGYAQDLTDVGRKLARWAEDVTKLTRQDLSNIDGLHNRAGDNWQPLLAIADLAGGAWPENALRAAKQAVVASMDEQGIIVQLLHDIKDAFGERDKMRSAEIVSDLVSLEDGPYGELRRGKPINQNWLAKQLKGIIRGNSHTIRIEQKTPKGYERHQFESAWKRYVASNVAEITATSATPQQALETQDVRAGEGATTHPPQRNAEVGDGKESAEMLRRGGTGVAGHEPDKPQKSTDCVGVAVVAPALEGSDYTFSSNEQGDPNSEVL